jgi:hypothetical protein
MTRVWESSKHKGTDLLVLLAIADHVGDENGLAWPSVATLARKSRMSHKNTQRVVRALIESGELVLVRQGDGRKSSVYRVTVEGGQVGTPHGGTPADEGAGVPPVGSESSGNRKLEREEMGLLLPIWKKRLGSIFNRKESTAWHPKEIKALRAIVPIDDADLAKVERYYRAERMKGEKNRSRRDLITMLNNWPGEVDRARVYCQRRDFAKQRRSGPAPAPSGPATDTDFKRAGDIARAELERFRAKMTPGAAENENENENGAKTKT